VARLYRRLKIALYLIIVVVAIGTLGYHIAGLSWIDALYQTVVTITGVGYTDLASGLNIKPFTIIMVGIGTLTLAVLISLLTATLVETQIREIIGRRKVESKVRKLENHFIICGLGRFGRIVATELGRKGIPFVVLEHDAKMAEFAREHGHLVLEADATEEESLTQAGIERCRGLLATLGTDADNVYVTLTAKQMKSEIRVVAVAREEGADRKLKAAGADEVVSPYRVGGAWMAQMISSPTAADFMKIATGLNPLDFYMDEQRIGTRSELVGRKLRETPIRSRYGVIVVGVRRADGTLVTNPPPDIELSAGDVLVSLGEQDKLEALHQLASGRG
jgi:voltage-gated potassium channel